VELVDFGDVFEPDATDLYRIPESAMQQPIQGVRCRLHGTASSPASIVSTVLRLYASKVALFARIITVSPTIVELVYTGCDGVDLHLSELVKSAVGCPSIVPPPPDFVLNTDESVTVCAVLQVCMYVSVCDVL